MYKPSDARALDILLDGNSGDVRLDLDEIVVAGEPVSGALVYRPGAFVHELRVLGNNRLKADALVNFAIGRWRAQDAKQKTAIFSVDAANIPMQHYVESLGAVRQQSQVIYTLTP